MTLLRRVSLLLLVPLLSIACEKEKPASETAVHADAGASKNSALDPDLAMAVAAASAAPAPGAAQQKGGPPPEGIFGPGGADQEIRVGQPPKLTLGSEGSDPKVSLGAAQPKPGTKVTGTIQVVQQSGEGGGGLPVEFNVTFEAQKPKTDGGAVPVVVRVNSARVGVTGAPKEIENEVAKLKGSKVEYEIAVDGAGTGYRFEVPKGVGQEFADLARALSDVLAMITLPRPQEAVGVGAYWMATSRDGVLGLDLVSYRLVKVDKIEGDRVTLSVDTKRYSSSPSFNLPGLPPNAPHSLAEFQSVGKGPLELESGRAFPVGGTQDSVLAATLSDPANPRARGMLQVQTHAELKL